MTFKKIVGKLHLWMGLASGLIVCWLGISGCILAFEAEIRTWIEDHRKVPIQEEAFLPPHVLRTVGEKTLPGKQMNLVEYLGPDDAAIIYQYTEKEYYQIFVNPYTGEVLKSVDMTQDFFRIMLMGHYELWLGQTGRVIVSSATLIFLFLLISGLILWWPKNKAGAKQRFRFKWKETTQWRRKNYDLHNVLGFYIFIIAFCLAFTGLIMGFEWFSKSVYYVSSGGKTLPEHVHPHSDSTVTTAAHPDQIMEQVWLHLMKQKTPDNKVGIVFPHDGTDALEGYVNHYQDRYYDTEYYHYDAYSGKELPAEGVYAGSFWEASLADKLQRMNYDIHVGSVLGLSGKFLVFFGSLIAASLPITGFFIWRGRQCKSKKHT
jgi:uncharacterized iron-regulated membrane protein